MPKRECEDFGNYEEGHPECSVCEDAEKCKAATPKPEAPEPQKGSQRSMPGCFW